MKPMHIALAPALALALSVPVVSLSSQAQAQTPTQHQNQACYECGVITQIQTFEEEGSGTAGAVAGAVAGGLLGNQVGGGSGRRLATAAGAVGGGIAGNRIQRSQTASVQHEVVVRMEDGRNEVVRVEDLGELREGTRVIVRDGRVYAR